VNIDSNRYTAPEHLIGKVVDVYKYINEIHLYHHRTMVAKHARIIGEINKKQKVEGHHTQKHAKWHQHQMGQAEKALQGKHEILDAYIAELKKRIRGTRQLTQLLHLQRTYPHDAFIAAVIRAHTYGLYDLVRLEELILKHIAGDFFNLSSDEE
jgi:hypothetical protein